ncbi:MarP family serine protease [Microbacterium sp. JZ70]
MPSVVDVLIVVLLLGALLSGLRAGFFAALGALCGLVAAGVAAPWVLPLVASAVPDEGWRGLAVIGSAVLLLALGASLGAAIGGIIRRGADRLRLRALERLLGGAFGLVAGTLAVSLTGAGIASAGIPAVSSSVASSSLLRTIDALTPAPLSEAMARLHSAILGETVLPTIDGLLGDLPDAADPGSADLENPALAAAAESVARVSGVAAACSTRPSGTGFVVAEDRIVTNAHVVAGVETPMVELPGEPARDGRIVYFDPIDDLAVIAVDVEAAPLALDDSVQAGDAGAVQGYPYGGPFRTVSAGIAASGPALIEDIYGESTTERAIYALEAEVAPGNSGGPLLSEDGTVAGVVFARDEARPEIGYAMSNAELQPVLDALPGATDTVSTGRCLG